MRPLLHCAIHHCPLFTFATIDLVGVGASFSTKSQGLLTFQRRSGISKTGNRARIYHFRRAIRYYRTEAVRYTVSFARAKSSTRRGIAGRSCKHSRSRARLSMKCLPHRIHGLGCPTSYRLHLKRNRHATVYTTTFNRQASTALKKTTSSLHCIIHFVEHSRLLRPSTGTPFYRLLSALTTPLP